MEHKAFDCRYRRQSDFCHNIRTYSKDQTYFFALGYDIVSDKTNLLVDSGVINHVITDKLKFINFDKKFWTRELFCWIGWWEPSKHSNEEGWLIYAIAKDTYRCILENVLYIYINF